MIRAVKGERGRAKGRDRECHARNVDHASCPPGCSNLHGGDGKEQKQEGKTEVDAPDTKDLVRHQDGQPKNRQYNGDHGADDFGISTSQQPIPQAKTANQDQGPLGQPQSGDG